MAQCPLVGKVNPLHHLFLLPIADRVEPKTVGMVFFGLIQIGFSDPIRVGGRGDAQHLPSIIVSVVQCCRLPPPYVRTTFALSIAFLRQTRCRSASEG